MVVDEGSLFSLNDDLTAPPLKNDITLVVVAVCVSPSSEPRPPSSPLTSVRQYSAINRLFASIHVCLLFEVPLHQSHRLSPTIASVSPTFTSDINQSSLTSRFLVDFVPNFDRLILLNLLIFFHFSKTLEGISDTVMRVINQEHE
ncbi:unnamed protein product [Lactuca saligna]|uniref:Uncharacterized protein n=1 Tax=Lactuca saligna TaxID=75948 RepID=A0AA35ZP92_LACSI|nr:unnamed protein product [Lactuca saligna]